MTGLLIILCSPKLICLLIHPDENDIYRDLGQGYVYAPWNEIHSIEKHTYSFTEFTIKQDINVKDHAKEHLDHIKNTGIPNNLIPNSFILEKVRYNKEYIIFKGYNNQDRLPYYWIIIKNTNETYGPLSPENFHDFQLNNHESIIYLLDQF